MIFKTLSISVIAFQKPPLYQEGVRLVSRVDGGVLFQLSIKNYELRINFFTTNFIQWIMDNGQWIIRCSAPEKLNSNELWVMGGECWVMQNKECRFCDSLRCWQLVDF